MTKPKGTLPASPRKSFAWCQFQRRNPAAAAAAISARTTVPSAAEPASATTAAMPKPRPSVSTTVMPSIPSMKL